MKTTLSKRSGFLAAWAMSIWLVAAIYGGHIPAYLLGIILVILPAAISFGSVLKFLVGRQNDIVFAMVLCIASGIIGFGMWGRGSISSLHMAFVWLPTYQLLLLTGAYKMFLWLIEREPVTVVFDPAAGKWPDRTFFISVTALHVIVPAMFLAKMD